ncbi:MAG: acyltransferase [Opitutaceae bacterium]|nr:acyltransferase [Opitutaceae bacterium]
MPCSFGTEPWLVTIGDHVTIAGGVSFLTHDGATWLARDGAGRRFRYARIEVGSRVFIGANAVLLPGVRVGSRVIVGAGSVVTRSVPAGAIVAGNPARIVGCYDDYESKALATFHAERTMVGTSRRERIDSIVECEFRPELIDVKRPG